MRKIAEALGPRMVRGGLPLKYCRFAGERMQHWALFRYVFIERLSKPLNLRRFEGKIANFENYSSFHEHGSALWRFECATFRFA